MSYDTTDYKPSPEANVTFAKHCADMDIDDEIAELRKDVLLAPREIVIPPGSELAKMYEGGTTRTRAIAEWLLGQLAIGKSLQELVEHAQRYDLRKAMEIQQIGNAILKAA